MNNSLRHTIVTALISLGLPLHGASVIQSSASTYNVTEGVNAQAEVVVQRTNDLDMVVSVDFATTTNGTATAGADYVEVSTNLTFLTNETNKLVAVPILNDGLVEGIETFQVALSNPTGGAVLGDRTNATVRITDNDKGLQLTAASYRVSEEVGSVEIGILRNDDGDYPITVDVATSDGTAVAGVDYVGVTNTVQLAAREILKLVPVPILNDTVWESSKNFRVTLSNPTGGGQLGSPVLATVTITNTDEVVQLEFGNYWGREDEGSVLIGVVRGENATSATVDVWTSDLTAKSGLDYSGLTNTLVFAAGERLKLIDIPILNDGLKEANETFRVMLGNPTGEARLGSQRTATVTILDNDPGVQFTQNQLWVHEDEGVIQLTVTRGNDQLLDAFTVDYTTTNGTAMVGSDYTETKGTLAFAAGEMTRSFAVPILDDGVAKLDRQFKVVLSNPTGGMALGTAAKVTGTVSVYDTREMLPHRFESIQVSREGVLALTLGGGYTPGLGLSNRFQPHFDIYPLEASTNLVDWIPLKWLVRTNASTNAVVFVDSEANSFTQRFYRTPAKTFVAPERVPSGPYPVGITDRTIRDDSRRNRYRISTNSSFPITIYYPANRLPGKWPAPYALEPGVRDPRAWGYIEEFAYFSRHSLRDAPFAPNLTGVPVVLWSHGGWDVRDDGMEWAEHIASHGYVVVSVDHFDSSYVVYPDGTYLFIDFADLTGRELSVQLLQDRVRDFAVVLDEMARWNQEDALFAGRLDVQNAAVMGWSYGGGAAAEFCRVDARGKAAIVLDGYFLNADTLLTTGLSKPILCMYAASLQDTGAAITLHNKATRDSIWFQVRDAEHASFWTYYPYLTSTTLDRRREIARTVTDYSIWFLNKYLKGSADPMPQPTNYPQVFNFRQK
jgi:dienelactone hydrolase